MILFLSFNTKKQSSYLFINYIYLLFLSFIFDRFDTGGGAALLRSEDKLIINRKYTLWIKRTGLSGELGIMGYNNTVYMEAPGTHTGLNVDPELLVGHVREDVTQKIPKR